MTVSQFSYKFVPDQTVTPPDDATVSWGGGSEPLNLHVNSLLGDQDVSSAWSRRATASISLRGCYSDYIRC